MQKFIRTFLFLVIAAGLGSPVRAADDTRAADLKKAESYLNGITTMKARFVQVNPNGGSVEGDLYISRPGRMRLMYDPPAQMLLVADGKFLIHVDTEMNDASHLDLNETPAGLLLKENLSFSDPDIKVIDVKRGAGTLEITAGMAKDPTAGKMTMVFSQAPFELRQWRVTNPDNQDIVVTLANAKTGVALDKDLFRYDARAARRKEQE